MSSKRTGGAFYIQAYKDGNKLDESAFTQMEVPAHLTGGLDPEMVLWKGEVDEEDNLTWVTLDNDYKSSGNTELFLFFFIEKKNASLSKE